MDKLTKTSLLGEVCALPGGVADRLQGKRSGH
jgi:hypothetical protein